jgi:hypothetical protein
LIVALLVVVTDAPSGVAATSAPTAMSFEDAVKAILEDVPNGFKNLRGAPKPRHAGDTDTTYEATITPSGASNCQVMVNDDTSLGSSLFCDVYWSEDPADTGSALARYKASAKQLAAYAAANGGTSHETDTIHDYKSETVHTISTATILSNVDLHVDYSQNKHASSNDTTLWVSLNFDI